MGPDGALATWRLGNILVGGGAAFSLLAAVVHAVNYFRPSSTAQAKRAREAAIRGRRAPRFGHPGAGYVALAWFGSAGFCLHWLGALGKGDNLAISIWLSGIVLGSFFGFLNAAVSRSQV